MKRIGKVGLGSLFSTIRQTDETKSYISNSCSRALFKIRKYCNKLGQLPPATAVALFDSLVAPLMDYSSEIWYKKTIADNLERFHLRYLKRILKVRKQTSTLAVYGELGQYPIHIRLQCNVLKYLYRVHKLPSNSLPSRVLKMLSVFHNQDKSNWLSSAMNVYNTFQSYTNMSFEAFLSKPELTIKNVVKSKLQEMYQQQWMEHINNIDSQPKLRTYCKFKQELLLEPYLSLVVPNQRSALSRFRCSVHRLAIETGRHHKPKIPLCDRICPECKVIEDEEHHLIHCVKNKEYRKVLFETANSMIENFCDLNPCTKFKQLMSCNNLKLQKAIAIFLIQSSL